jgi:hypothetical protein
METQLPSRRVRPPTIGIAIGVLGGLIGLGLVLFTDVYPWGFVILTVSGLVAFTAAILYLAWEWDHVP